MKRLNLMAVALGVALCVSPVRAADELVTFFSTGFFPVTLSLEAGDTVTWEWTGGTHELRSGTPTSDPGALFSATVDAANPTFSYTFTLPGTYAFHDATNSGVIGFVTVQPFTFEVQIVNNAFVPQDAPIFEGDRIRWTWIEGDHTVTDGASSNPLDNPGSEWDEDLDQAQQNFEQVFTDVGIHPYFCRPHEVFNMDGTIIVQRLFMRGDVNSDGNLSLADPIATLNFLFTGGNIPTCLDAADSNDDGQINLSDVVALLAYQFAGGSIAAPFGTPGADRTPDNLLCL